MSITLLNLQGIVQNKQTAMKQIKLIERSKCAESVRWKIVHGCQCAQGQRIIGRMASSERISSWSAIQAVREVSDSFATATQVVQIPSLYTETGWC